MRDEQKTWTVLEMIEWSTQYLEGKGVEDSRLNIERLLAHVLHYDRVKLYINFDRPLKQDELQEFKSLLLRRAKREPLQYILGETEFYSLSLNVRPGVLIPRPETEILIETAIDSIEDKTAELSILDIGCGSGAITVALAVHFNNATIQAVDISKSAIETSRENAMRHKVDNRIHFHRSDFLEWGNEAIFESGFDLIVSNPPYISFEEKNTLEPEVKEFEPADALFAEEPLQFYKAIADFAQANLSQSGRVICEISPNLEKSVSAIFQQAGLCEVSTVIDLADKPRIVTGKRPAQEMRHA